MYLIIILLSIAIVIVIYQLIHRSMIRRATLIVQRNGHAITDKTVFKVLRQLLKSKDFANKSDLVTDVWGKGVLSFQYEIYLDKLNGEDSKRITRQLVQDKLNESARQQDVKYFKRAKQAFLITDWWQREDILHFDVTYLSNEASYEYVHDLKKLGQ